MFLKLPSFFFVLHDFVTGNNRVDRPGTKDRSLKIENTEFFKRLSRSKAH